MKKVEVVKNSTKTSNKKQLQSWLGMVTYLRRFIPNMSQLTEPLRLLIYQDTPWRWEDSEP